MFIMVTMNTHQTSQTQHTCKDFTIKENYIQCLIKYLQKNLFLFHSCQEFGKSIYLFTILFYHHGISGIRI